MRLRNKNWTKAYIANHPEMMVDFVSPDYIDLANTFDNDNDVFALEIGSGKGQFSFQQALNNPEVNFIAMEKESTVVGVALRKVIETSEQEDYHLTNLKFFNNFAENLTTFFAPKSFTTIYLNFSDPWPKAKHFKKRLTHAAFLDQYHQLLVPKGRIEIKTDNTQLFTFSLYQLQEDKRFRIVYKTTDLYNDPKGLVDNQQTEYEEKFHLLGKKIYKIILQKR